MSGMKRKTTPLALSESRGLVAKAYTLSMDTASTELCFASFGFCSRICEPGPPVSKFVVQRHMVIGFNRVLLLNLQPELPSIFVI